MAAGNPFEVVDARGRRISLLNNEPMIPVAQSSSVVPAYSNPTTSTPAPSAVVYNHHSEAQLRGTSASPLYPPPSHHTTPGAYDDYGDYPPYGPSTRRPSSLSLARSSSFEDDISRRTSGEQHKSERTGKRFACRLRAETGCQKTFTTSGHASRHAKIHTAEKAVQCTHPGCSKKFTRADNMKQHLDTHLKGKSRNDRHRRSP